MTKFIGIETIAGNALIELYERKGIVRVDFAALVRYGERVRKEFESHSDDEIILLIDRRYQISMAENYPEFFDIDFSHQSAMFYLNSKGTQIEDTIKELKNYFRWSLSMKLLEAFMSEEAIKALV